MTTKKSKTKTTPAAVKLTPKQASIASVNLLRGLDNAIRVSQKNTSNLEVLKSRVGSLSAGLSNLASAPTPAKPAPAKASKPAAKAAPKAPAAKPQKPAAKAAPKAAKPQKPAAKAAPAPKAPAAKAAPAAKPAKAAPAAKPSPASADPLQKEPVSGRPSVRTAVKEALLAAGGSMQSLDLRKTVCAKYGRWSNQTFYELFKDDPELKLENKVVSLVAAPKVDKDLELVKRVEQDRTTAAVV